MSKDFNGIGIIHRGQIVFYCPFIIENDDNIFDVYQRIKNQLDTDMNKYLYNIQEPLQETLDIINNDNGNFITAKFKKKIEFVPNKKCCINPQKVDFKGYEDESSIFITEKNDGIEVTLNLEEILAFDIRREQLLNEYRTNQQLYGDTFVRCQDRYILFPLKLELYNGNYVWLHAMAYIYSNRMGILKIELPLIDVTPDYLYSTELNEYIKNVFDVWGISSSPIASTIDSIKSAYMKYLGNVGKITIVAHQPIVTNTILVDFEGIPKQIDNIPDELALDLYRIISAPISMRDCTSYKSDAKNYIRTNYWGNHNIKYITSSMGNCLSIIDKALLEWEEKAYKDSTNKTTISDEEYDDICSCLIKSVDLNVEFALMIVILKRINVEHTLLNKYISHQHLQKVQNEYYQNIVFISELQKQCYGTVRDQLSAFESQMKYYIKTDILNQQMDAIDHMIADEEARRTKSFQNFLSIGGLAAAFVFALPAIHETLELIRALSAFISYDIPYISIANLSFACWSIMLFVLVLNIVNKNDIKNKSTRKIKRK